MKDSSESPSGLSPGDAVELSVVLPVFNEEESIRGVLDELLAVLRGLGRTFEVLAVNDGSRDGTLAHLRECRRTNPELRVISLSRNCGQSAAFGAGFREARGRVTVLLDADGQNDPHDIPAMLDAMAGADACCGIRANRKDTLGKRWGGRLANRTRNLFLRDGIIDTGCSLKAMRTDMLRHLPMQFAGMHRFIPALLQMEGARVAQIPVNHRPRSAGRSKYTNLGRLRVTVADLFAVRWMRKRHRRFTLSEES